MQPTSIAAEPRERIILGIESSCDDTGVAVVTSSGRVLGEALATQADIHAPWGGVVPNLAMEAHKAAIHGTVEEALRQAGLSASQLDAVAVTVGPGLSLCLRVRRRRRRRRWAAATDARQLRSACCRPPGRASLPLPTRPATASAPACRRSAC
jgi:hypothetical protein